jgi:hypothetical protein
MFTLPEIWATFDSGPQPVARPKVQVAKTHKTDLTILKKILPKKDLPSVLDAMCGLAMPT